METLDEYLKEFYTPETVKSYKREINRFLAENPEAESLVYKDLVGYVGIIRKRYSNAGTVQKIIAGIKSYYGFLAHTGKRRDNPAASLKLRDRKCRDIQLQDLLSPKELKQLQEAENPRQGLEMRNRVLLSLLIYQALRTEELEALTVNGINFENATVQIKATAKTEARELPLQAQQAIQLLRYIENTRKKLLKRKKTDRLLVGQRGNPMQAEDIAKHIRRHYKNSIEGRAVTATAIRQSVITNMLKAGKDLREVQVFAGHRYISSTEKYKQTDLEALKAEIEKHYPLK